MCREREWKNGRGALSNSCSSWPCHPVCFYNSTLGQNSFFFFSSLSSPSDSHYHRGAIVVPSTSTFSASFVPFFFCLRAEDDEDESPFQLYNRLVVSFFSFLFFSFLGLIIIKEEEVCVFHPEGLISRSIAACPAASNDPAASCVVSFLSSSL